MTTTSTYRETPIVDNIALVAGTIFLDVVFDYGVKVTANAKMVGNFDVTVTDTTEVFSGGSSAIGAVIRYIHRTNATPAGINLELGEFRVTYYA
jgi:ribulose kinase